MSPFTHLNVHSSYSKMEGVATPHELVGAAEELGYKTLALTDTNGLYGIVFFIQAAREAGIEPIVGSEVVSGGTSAGGSAGRRALLLVKTNAGYSNLCRIISERHCDPSFDLADAIRRWRDGLIVATDDDAVLLKLKRESSDDLYVEMSPGHLAHQAYALSKRTGIPPLATNRVRFITSDDHRFHKLLRAIQLNTRLSRLRPEDVCTDRNYFTTPVEMNSFFPHAPHAIENTIAVASACKRDWDFRETIFPAYRSLNDDQAYRLLREMTFDGARRRYGEVTPAVVVARIEHELAVIREKRFVHYFLLVEDIVKESSLTCGRGSGAASIVSYCLRITDVDPIRHNLFFERFLNPGRVDPPDIDVDFAWDERDRIIDYVFAKFGAQRCAMVANHPSLQARAAIREVAKVYGMPDAEIGRITSRMARLWYEDAPLDAIHRHPLFKDIQLPPPWPDILDEARYLAGHFRHISLHCGGVVVVPDDIRKYVPVEIAPKGLQVIQWEKDQTEDAGLVKIDLLGNRSLAVIRDAVAAVMKFKVKSSKFKVADARMEALDFLERMHPADDAATCDLIRRGDTMGCFYIESPATRLLLRKMWGDNRYPGCDTKDVFEHVVMASSIIRPAANQFAQDFVKRMHGEKWEHIHPLLKPVLDETYGVMIYQEQVTQIAMAMAGFSAYDGDQLRKVLTKKHRERKLRDYYQQFIQGARERGVPSAIVRQIWEQILSFSGYSFCKPHSASYAMVSFKSAYLRVHYPAELIAAVISNQGGYYSTFAYISEARRMGLRVLPPDVNESEIAYTGCTADVDEMRASSPHAVTRPRGHIRIGLMQLKSLNAASAEQIVAERHKGGPFISFEDFMRRIHIPPADVKILIKAGCCDLFGLTRPALMWRLYQLVATDAPRIRQPGLFEEEEEVSPARMQDTTDHRLISSQYDPQALLRHEIETLGFLASRHPLDLHRDLLRGLRYVPAADIHRHTGHRVTMIGWLVTSKLVHTKHGEPMEFVSFEDTTAIYEATFFPDAYRRFCHMLSHVKPYVLRGKVEADQGAYTLTVEWIGLLDDLAHPQPTQISKPVLTPQSNRIAASSHGR
ncbi:MAG: DNA polymerase III subunit alpha [Acidobacteria bacterium]|nr:DNA polymerase III subunit alpha [Acidobacteriota bacterium]